MYYKQPLFPLFQDGLLDKLDEVKPELAESPEEEVREKERHTGLGMGKHSCSATLLFASKPFLSQGRAKLSV